MSLLNATDARHFIADDLDRVSPRGLGHYLRAGKLLRPEPVWSIAQDVNAGVFGGTGLARQMDAVQAVGQHDATVVYLDPPYRGVTGYPGSYAPLDALLGDEPPAVAVPTLDELLTASEHIPFVVLSYGGPTVTLDSLIDLVGRHRRVTRAISIPYPRLRSLASKERVVGDREHLVFAER